MTRTREENAADLAREEAEKAARTAVYTVVKGTPSTSADRDVPGIYSALVDTDLPDAMKAEVALEHFQENNGIECLDDFEISVHLADGSPLPTPLPRLELHEPSSLWVRGQYGDFVGDCAPEPVQAVFEYRDAPAHDVIRRCWTAVRSVYAPAIEELRGAAPRACKDIERVSPIFLATLVQTG